MARTICGLMLLCWMAAPAAQTAHPDISTRAIRGGFDDVRERLVMALENRGLVINYTARVGAMLERTGRDLGRDKPVFGKAEVLEFCSARISRETMEADPHNIVFCPYAIAVYTLPAVPGTVYLSYRMPAPAGSAESVRALGAVRKLLADIVGEAAR